MLVEVVICARSAARRKWGTGVIALLWFSALSFAADITLGWKPSSDPNVVGYNVYYGIASGTYTNVVDAGPATSVTIPSLVPGTTYFFAATSYDLSGLEGLFSPEMSYTIPSAPPDNQPPTLDPIGDLRINENTAAQSINLTGISSGATDEVQTLSITATSSDLNLIPNPAVSYASPNSTGILTFTPAPKAFGSTTIFVTVNDGGVSNNTIVRSFTVTINQVMAPPTLDPIANVVIKQYSGAQTINLTGISSGANAGQTLSITAVSSDLTIIPSPTVSYSSPSPTATLMFTPTPNAYGVATITVTLDNGLPTNNTTVRSFTITVDQVSSPPMLQITASAPGTLTALGNVGTSYQVQFATNLLPTLVWHPLLTFTQTNASQTLNVGTSNSMVLYRLMQQ
jgi:hypothetical protein